MRRFGWVLRKLIENFKQQFLTQFSMNFHDIILILLAMMSWRAWYEIWKYFINSYIISGHVQFQFADNNVNIDKIFSTLIPCPPAHHCQQNEYNIMEIHGELGEKLLFEVFNQLSQNSTKSFHSFHKALEPFFSWRMATFTHWYLQNWLSND